MMRHRAIAAGIFFACCNHAFAQDPSLDVSQYAHTAWRLRDGFFKGTIISVAQTPDGYLWLGTEFGLLRFDGVRSIPWQSPDGAHLPGTNIRRLLTTRDGRLWIGTNEGLASWKDGKLTHYAELAGQDILALLEDHEGTVWVGGWATSAGRLCGISGNSSRCDGQDGRLGSGVATIYEDSKGNLWVSATTGLWRWKPDSPKRYPISNQVPEIVALTEGDDGTLLVATRGGMGQFVDEKVKPWTLPGVGQFQPDRLLRDRDGGLWIGTVDRGLVHLHQGRVDSFSRPDGLSGDFVLSLFEDREGDIWIATTAGLDRFRTFAIPTISVKQGLSNASVTSVLAASDGSVWLATFAGLNRWKNGRIATYRGGLAGLPDDSVQSLFEDDHRRIWVATVHGVSYFENGRFNPVSAVPGGQISSIVGDSQGNIWIDQQVLGLLHLRDGKVVEKFSWDHLGHKGLALSLLTDPSSGELWLGFFKGGVASVKAGRVSASYGVAEGLGAGMVSSLQLDRSGVVWAGTQSGLSRLENGHVTTLTSRNGLPCDAVNWMAEDDTNSFWLGMACGLVRIPRPELEQWTKDSKRIVRTTVFDSSDGVASHVSAGSYSPRVAKTSDGKLWFLPFDGVSVIDPRHLPFNKLPPPVHIEQITADRKTYWSSIGDPVSKLHLPPSTRDVEIAYTALSLVAPEKIRFKIRLDGRDRDWEEVGNRRQAFYSDLAPRHYRFRVIASNNNGVWNEEGASFDFSVDPAYYQTAWFRTLCGAAILALCWGFYRYRLHQISREFNVRLAERIDERTRLARDLHDTLLQSFHGLMLRFQAVTKLLPEGKAKQQLDATLDLADRAIAEGRSAVYDLRSSVTLTNDLAEAINAIGNELSNHSAAAFDLMVEGATKELHPIIRDEIYRISREALNNAFRHAHARHIEAEIGYEPRAFRLRIRDNGEGIPPDILEQGRAGHFGLPGMRERAKQIGADLTIWSRPGAGTEIDLSLAGKIAYSSRHGDSGLGHSNRKGDEK